MRAILLGFRTDRCWRSEGSGCLCGFSPRRGAWKLSSPHLGVAGRPAGGPCSPSWPRAALQDTAVLSLLSLRGIECGCSFTSTRGSGRPPDASPLGCPRPWNDPRFPPQPWAQPPFPGLALPSALGREGSPPQAPLSPLRACTRLPVTQCGQVSAACAAAACALGALGRKGPMNSCPLLLEVRFFAVSCPLLVPGPAPLALGFSSWVPIPGAAPPSSRPLQLQSRASPAGRPLPPAPAPQPFPSASRALECWASASMDRTADTSVSR